MQKFVGAVVIAAFIVAGVAVVFYLGVGQGVKPSEAAKDWADFGSFYGGVAGALLSFFTVILLIHNAHQQLSQIQAAHQEAKKRDLLQYITRAEDHIDHWLGRKLPTTQGGDVELGDIVWGLHLPDIVTRSVFDKSLNRLLQLTCSYCVALGLYRANIDSHFTFRLHRDKALKILEYLHAHQDSLPQLAGASIQFCRMQVNGENTT